MIRIVPRLFVVGVTVAAAPLLFTACGRSSTGPDGDGSMAATVDGRRWRAHSNLTDAAGAAGGVFTVVGADEQGRSLTLLLYNIGAPGTYPLGVGASVFGGTGQYSEAATTWWTPLSGGGGSVTITEVSSTRIAGTFTFLAAPLFGSAGGTRNVTDGSFDMAVNGPANVSVPANKGSRFGGSLGGASWNAAAVALVSGPSTGTLEVAINNDAHQVVMVLEGFTGPATYGMGANPPRTFSVTNLSTGKAWGGANVANTGSVVVTSVSTDRVTGTYDVTLQPASANPGTGTLRLTGEFDLGLS